jgi:ribonuclease P protein component
MPARTVGRIRTRAAFRQLQRGGARGSSGPVRATFVPAEPSSLPGAFPQVGYAIERRCGNAVTRNTLRRRMREAVRASADDLPVGTYLLRAEPPAVTIPPDQLWVDVARALRRAAQKAGAS